MEAGTADASSNSSSEEYVYSCVRRVCDGCGASLAFTPMPAFLHRSASVEFETLESEPEPELEQEAEPDAEQQPAQAPAQELEAQDQQQHHDPDPDTDDEDDNDDDEDEDTAARGCPQPRQQSLRWFTCEQCPEMDFCETCKGQHEHTCVAGRCHDQLARCVNCSEGLSTWYSFTL